MNLGPDSDYREGIFWLLAGGGFVVMGLAQLRWLGIQSWYLYAVGIGLIIVGTILVPRRVTLDRLRRGWRPILIGLVVSVLIAVLSAEVGFVSVFPLVTGLLWIGSGLWLMVRPERPSQ
jgi:hypothetical protein